MGIRRVALDGTTQAFHASWWLVPFSLPLLGSLALIALFAHYLPGLRTPVSRGTTAEDAWADHDRRAREAAGRLRWVKVGFALGYIPWMLGLAAMILRPLLGDDATPATKQLFEALVFLILALIAMNVPNMLRWARARPTVEPVQVTVSPGGREGLPPSVPQRILLRGFLKVLACAVALPAYVLVWLFGFGSLADHFGHREGIMNVGFFASFVLVIGGVTFLFARIDRLK
jgi:hypothetical protein